MSNDCSNMALSINPNAKNLEICKSDDYLTSLVSRMHIFFQGGQFCDVTLIAENDGVEVEAHRMVLSAASKYFLAMFSGSLREANAKQVPMKEVTGTTLKSVINFIYTGSIELATDTAVDIIKTAHLFGLNSLQDLCCDYLGRQLDLSNCVGIAFFAEQYNLKSLYETTEVFVCRNFMHICHEEEFFQLDHNQLGRFLSSNDIRVPSEADVFLSMMSWVEYNRPKREQYIDKLIHNVRFPLLLPKFISDTVEPVCNSTETMQLICNAYKWHLLPDSRLTLFSDEETQLRNFTDTIVAVRGLSNANDALSVGFYYPALQRWIYRDWPGLPEPRTNFSCATINGKLIIAGGMNATTNRATNRVDCLDLNTLEWTQLPGLRTARYSFGMVTFKGRVYAVGGRGEGTLILTSVETYDPVSLQWKYVVPMSFAIDQIRVADSVNTLCVAKRKMSNRRTTQFSHIIYDPLGEQWTDNWLISDGELLGMGTVKVSSTDFFIVVSQTSITKYNFETQSSTTIAINNLSAEYTNCTVNGDRIIVYGSTKFLEYHPLENEWKAIPDLDNRGTAIVVAI